MHKEAIELEEKLKSLAGLIADRKERGERAKKYIQSSISQLLGDDPKLFNQAVGKGVGPFIQILEAAASGGYGENLVIESKFNPLAQTISKTEEGYHLKTTLRQKTKDDGTKEIVRIVKAIIFTKELPAVSEMHM